MVVTDLDATAATLSAVLGYEWGPEIGGPIAVDLPDGSTTIIELKFRYSTTVPRLEIIRSVAGSLWEPVRDAGIHHTGYWSDDVAADVAALTRYGYRIEATGKAGNGQMLFAFLSGAHGFRVELVNRAVEPGLAQCWTADDSASDA
ncbi:VOC family protein [Nocardia sp. NPDC005745]|uniref:VOC family protein n=1 Tax=Nocardia sp. NPDC005745 TaxID=3157061 RepID=UPI0033C18D91